MHSEGQPTTRHCGRRLLASPLLSWRGLIETEGRLVMYRETYVSLYIFSFYTFPIKAQLLLWGTCWVNFCSDAPNLGEDFNWKNGRKELDWSWWTGILRKRYQICEEDFWESLVHWSLSHVMTSKLKGSSNHLYSFVWTFSASKWRRKSVDRERKTRF